MKHQGTNTLETERLILRRYRTEDAADMFPQLGAERGSHPLSDMGAVHLGR